MPEVWSLLQRRAALEAPSRRLRDSHILLFRSPSSCYDFKHCNIPYSLGPALYRRARIIYNLLIRCHFIEVVDQP